MEGRGAGAQLHLHEAPPVAGRYFFNSTSTRDALALDLVDWLVVTPSVLLH
jgi:hypothetical protein